MDGHGMGGGSGGGSGGNHPHNAHNHNRPRDPPPRHRTPQRAPSSDLAGDRGPTPNHNQGGGGGGPPPPPPPPARGYAGYQPHHHGPGHHNRGPSHGGGGGGHHGGIGGGGHRRGSSHHSSGGLPGLGSSPGNGNPGGSFDGGGERHFGHYGHQGGGSHGGGGGGGHRGGGGGTTPRSGGFRKGFNPGGGGHAASQKEREMLSIYGRGGGAQDNLFDASNPNNIPLHEPFGEGPHGPHASHGGGGGGGGFTQDGPHGAHGGVGGGGRKPPTGGGTAKWANPCRFAGHDHEWKDCPKNFRNKKKGKKGGGGHAPHGGGPHGGPHGGKGAHHGGGGAGGKSFASEAGAAVGHYGPAAAQGDNTRGLERGGMERGGSSRSLGSSDGFGHPSGHGTLGGDRGYHSAGNKNFGEDPQQRGPQRFPSHGSQSNVFSPKPPHGAVRQQSWGERHRRDHPRDHPRDAPHPREHPRDAPYSPTHAKPQVAHSHPPPPPPLPSPVPSKHHDRGYAFSPHAAARRGRSAGSERTTTPGSQGGHLYRDREGGSTEDIMAPPLSRTMSSPGELRDGRRDGERKSLGGTSGTGAAAAREATAPGLTFRSPPPLHAAAASGRRLPPESPREAPSKDFSSPHSALASPAKPMESATTAELYGDLSPRLPVGSPRYGASPREKTEREEGLTSPGEVTERKGAMAQGQGTPQQPALAEPGSPEEGEVAAPPSSKPPPAPSTPQPAAAAAKAPAPETPKEKRPSLTCAHLVDAAKMRKAEDIVASMVRHTDFKVSVGEGGGLPLPTKMEITHCMGAIETRIKDKMKKSVGARREVRELQAREEEARKAREEAEERKAREERAAEERTAREEEEAVRTATTGRAARAHEREDTLSRSKAAREETRATHKKSSSDLRRAHMSRLRHERRSETMSAAAGLRAEIATLSAELDEAEREAAAEELRTLERAAEEAREAMPEDDPTDAEGTKVPTLDMPGKMSGLVAGILAENRRRAREAHLEVLGAIPYFPDAAGAATAGGSDERDPREVSNEEWSNRARRVTGQHDALYTDPAQVPGYHEHNARFLELAPRLKDCIRRRDQKLQARWEDLANQYVVRQMLYNEKHGWTDDASERGGYFSAGMPKDTAEVNMDGTSAASSPATPASSVRGNNPYRRPRRGPNPGDVVRSDYEQEQIIAELAAKEAMEKRIREGGCALPRQRGWLEGRLYATHSDGLFGRRVDDPLFEMEERRNVNLWSDMEKCIFLDRFLHHPKDFRKIASFLKNKTTKDCVQFYYDSKKAVPYKHALKEFLQRKKRRGDAVAWDATIQCCLAMGARIKAGTGPDQPLKFILPENDYTYRTRHFHPMRLEVFETLEETVLHSKHTDEGKVHGGKKKRSNWFILDPHEKIYLKHGDADDHHHHHHHHHSSKRKRPAKDSESEEDERPKKASRKKKGADDGAKKPPATKPQKWKEKEKKLFYAALDAHGHDWTAVSEAVGTRSAVQVKNYFYDNRKSIAKEQEKAAGKAEKAAAAAKAPKKKKAKKAKKPPAKSEASTPTTDENDASAARGIATVESYVETEQLQRAETAAYQHQLDSAHQHQLEVLRRYQAQQQAAQQQAAQQQAAQQQHIEMLRQQQLEQQQEQYRRQRQQEMIQAAQQLQQQQAQQQLDHQQLQSLQQVLAMRARSNSHSPHAAQTQYAMHPQQHYGHQGGGGGGQQHSDLERIYQAAASAGIPASALEAALASARGGGGMGGGAPPQHHQHHQHQHQQSNVSESQSQQMANMELLRRLAAQQQNQQQQNHQGGGNFGGYHGYQR